MRQHSVHLSKCSSSNLPVQALSRNKWKKVNLADPVKDPYIVALLIAVAQDRRASFRMDNHKDVKPPAIVYPVRPQK